MGGIPYHPIVSIPIGPFHIYVWGLFFALAFFICGELAERRVVREGVSPETFSKLVMAILLGAVVGGRLGYIFQNISAYRQPLDWFKVWEGGMSFHGGFLGGLLLGWLTLRRAKLSFFPIADTLSPYVMLGYGIVRIGCLLIADHIGKPTQVPWGIYYDGALRHPISFYHALVGYLGFWLLLRFRSAVPGEKFFLMIGYYGVGRFLTEFFRVEPFLAGLHLAQWVSLGLMGIGGAGIFILRKQARQQFSRGGRA